MTEPCRYCGNETLRETVTHDDGRVILACPSAGSSVRETWG